MSNHPFILIKTSANIDEIAAIMNNLTNPERFVKGDDGNFYFGFGWYRLTLMPNPFPRRDAPAEDWFPPFDTYTYQVVLEAFTERDKELDTARTIFGIFRGADIWSLALTWDYNTVHERYYPATPEGDEARRIDEDEAAIVPLPSHNRTIFIQSDAELPTLGPELGAVLGSNWTNSQVIDNLTKEVATFFSYSEAKASLGVNEKYSPKTSKLLQPSPSGLYKYSLYMRDYEGPVEQLKNANLIFERLEAVGKWSLLLVEDNEKVLNRFDPAGS